MGCGIARFGRKGLKTTETWKFWSQNLSPGVLRRGAPGVSRHSTMGFRGAAQGFRGTARWGFEAQHHGVSRGSNTDKTLRAVPRGPVWLPGTSRSAHYSLDCSNLLLFLLDPLGIDIVELAWLWNRKVAEGGLVPTYPWYFPPPSSRLESDFFSKPDVPYPGLRNPSTQTF